MTASNNHPHPEDLNAPPDESRPRIVVINGPTAVGKTAFGIAVALEFDGEVVNADSRYLYRGFSIGVAKPDPIERQGVPHHLIDILPPDGTMSLARFQDLAMAALTDVVARDHLPLLVGGTPLYINAVVEGWRIPRVPPDPARRSALEEEARQSGLSSLIARLRHVDPVAADRCGANPRRIVRALEIYEATGIPMSRQEGKGPPPFIALELGLTMPRKLLYQAVDDRIRFQIDRGLVAEVKSLLEQGTPHDAPAMSSLGYRQLIPFLRGERTLGQAIERIRLDTHRYVRHQETWLRRNPRLISFDVSRPGWQEAAVARIRAFLDGQ